MLVVDDSFGSESIAAVVDVDVGGVDIEILKSFLAEGVHANFCRIYNFD